MTSELDNRPKANYSGDVTSSIGQIVGPNLSGEYLVIDEVDYSPETNKSVVRFRYATIGDRGER